MKNKKLLPILLLCSLLSISLFSCINLNGHKRVKGSGKQITATPEVKGQFDAIDVRNAVSVEFAQGSTASVRIEGDDNVVNALITQVKNGMLEIKLPNNHSFSDYKLKAFVTAPSLRSISLDAAASFSAQSLVSDDLRLDADAASSFYAKSLVSNNLRLDVDAASNTTIDSLSIKGKLDVDVDAASSVKINDGKVDRADIDVDAASSFNAPNFTIGCASLSVDAASHAMLKALSFDKLSVNAVSKVTSYMYNGAKPTIANQEKDKTSEIEFKVAN